MREIDPPIILQSAIFLNHLILLCYYAIMKKSLHILEQISRTLSSHQTYYKFNQQDEHLSLKYRKGRVSASKWLNELIFFYIQKEKGFINEFIEHIQNQKKDLQHLPETDFKTGLYDELNLIEEMINDKASNK